MMHPLYKKFIRRSKKYAAHDEQNVCVEGDTVRIVECAPISKRKTWMLLERNGETGRWRAGGDRGGRPRCITMRPSRSEGQGR